MRRLPTGVAALDSLSREMDELFNRMWAGPGRLPARAVGVFPLLNGWEDEENYFLEAELPGLKLEDLELVVAGNELTIRGERHEPPTAEGQPKPTYHRRERRQGRLQRVVRLPATVDAEHVEANLRHGVLTIRLPKAAEAKPRKIQVKSGNEG